MNSSEMYNVILEVRKARGLSAKKEILRRNPGIAKILKVTYNPFIHFFITPPKAEWAPSSMGKDFDTSTNSLLNRLSRRDVVGTAARREVLEHMRQLNQASANLLYLVLSKSVEAGISVKSINAVWPDIIPVHRVQLAKLYDESKATWPMLISPKLDGLRCTYRNVKLLSRNGIAFVGLDHLVKVISETLPEGAELDGELMVPGKQFDEISGTIRAFRKTDEVVYHVFDAPSDNDLDYRLTEATGFVNALSAKSSCFKFVPHFRVLGPEHAEAVNSTFMDEGFEGSILKNPHAPYLDGRSWDWMKIKPVENLDLKVTDVFPGEGKYTGMLGGVIVDYNGVSVRVGGGLSDAQRRHWMDDPYLIIGKVVEVAFQNVTPKGSLRHPRLKTVRGDKDAR